MGQGAIAYTCEFAGGVSGEQQWGDTQAGPAQFSSFTERPFDRQG